MRTLDYKVCFATPAFLGNAEQQAQWRTPPFKALIRQWWRVATAKDHGFRHQALRMCEGRLFGNAWIENDFRKSAVRLRLDRWENGKLTKWDQDPPVFHPEVGRAGKNVGSHLYLGYGPLTYNKKTILKANAAIQTDESATIRLAWPENANVLADVMQLIHWFGTVGGRSRNGWGSLLLEGGELKGLDALTQSSPLLQMLARSLDQCLQLDWPHAIGRDSDGRLLIWMSKKPLATWRDAMVELARVKIEFRAKNPKLGFDAGRIGPKLIDRRHVLAYPVTNHEVRSWGRQARLANQLRFKVARNVQGKFVALACHLPCGLPAELLKALKQDRKWIADQQLDVWRSVHKVLDEQMRRMA